MGPHEIPPPTVSTKPDPRRKGSSVGGAANFLKVGNHRNRSKVKRKKCARERVCVCVCVCVCKHTYTLVYLNVYE